MPEVLPVINCADAECVERKLRQIEAALPEAETVHIDVADGRFTFNKSWNDPKAWAALRPRPGAEVHLMVEEPELFAPAWLEAGAKRLIVHFEALASRPARLRPAKPDVLLKELETACRERGAELMLALCPETPGEKLGDLAKTMRGFQVLAVTPGPAGQPFLPSVLPKISFLRTQNPDARIEVDGGITPETARRAKEAGADSFASDSFIFRNEDPAAAYRELAAI